MISFDDTPRWVVPTAFLDDPAAVQAQIGSIAPGGGTAIFPALEAAYNDIVDARGEGQAHPAADRRPLVRRRLRPPDRSR